MNSVHLLSLCIFMFVSTITPGPNVVMITASGANFGIKRSLPHLFGIPAGIYIIMGLESLGISHAFEHYPMIPLIIKVLGSAYLLWLALQLAQRGKPVESNKARPLTMKESLLMQFLNPKGWILTLTVLTGYAVPGDNYWWSVLAVITVYAWSGTLTSGIWLVLGSQIAKVLRTEPHWRLFNKVMALLTAGCAVLLWTGV